MNDLTGSRQPEQRTTSGANLDFATMGMLWRFGVSAFVFVIGFVVFRVNFHKVRNTFRSQGRKAANQCCAHAG